MIPSNQLQYIMGDKGNVVKQSNAGDTNPTEPSKDTSRPGREEEVIDQQSSQDTPITQKDDIHSPETGKKRYSEGLANNDNEEQQSIH